jgi:hypothetical protein
LSFPVQKEVSERKPISVIQAPVLIDYVDSFNYMLIEELERVKDKEAADIERQAALKFENEALQRDQKEKAEAYQKRIKLAEERARMEENRKERIRLLKLEKIQGYKDKNISNSKKMKLSDMQTKGIGKTHQSCCHHHSRDQLGRCMTSNEQTTINHIGFINTSLAVQHRTLNKSMPIDNVVLEPFGEPLATTEIKIRRPKSRELKDSYQDDLSYIRGLPKDIDQSNNAESDIIFETLLNSSQKLPDRKWFLPSISYPRSKPNSK